MCCTRRPSYFSSQITYKTFRAIITFKTYSFKRGKTSSVGRVLYCRAGVASCFHSQGRTNNQGLNWSGSYWKLLDLRVAQMTTYWIMSELYRIGDGNTLSSINTSCCRIHSQSYFPGKGKGLVLRTRSWNKAVTYRVNGAYYFPLRKHNDQFRIKWKLSSPLMRLYGDNETTNQMEPKCG